jgi:hypothetical protein
MLRMFGRGNADSTEGRRGRGRGRRAALAAVSAMAGLGAGGARAQQRETPDPPSRQAVADSVRVFRALENRAKTDTADISLRIHIVRLGLFLGRQSERTLPPNTHDWEFQTAAVRALNQARERAPDDSQVLLLYSSAGSAISGVLFGAGDRVDALTRLAEVVQTEDDSLQAGAQLLSIGIGVWEIDYEGFLAIPRAAGIDAEMRIADPLSDSPGTEYQAVGPIREPIAPRGGRPSDRHDACAAIRGVGLTAPAQIMAPASVTQAAGTTTAALPLIMSLAIAKAYETLFVENEPMPAERHYLNATAFIERAYAVMPRDSLAWRWMAKTRVTTNRFAELETLGRERISVAPEDPWGWMALGLARQRQRAMHDARVAFDSALVRMRPGDREQLDRIERVLRPSERPLLTGTDSATRASVSAATWQIAKPLWSFDVDDPRTEFLARLAFAEFRWGSLRPRVLGADTYPGQIYVRYGPPVAVLNTFWVYDGGLIFAQEMGNAGRCAVVDRPLNERVKEWQPTRWDNVTESRIDSMPVMAARFRAGRDSVDFFLATRAPMELFDSMRTIDARPFANVWLSSWTRTSDAFHDSLDVVGSGELEFRRRLAAGEYYVRVEAVIPGTRAAGRASATLTMQHDSITGFSTRGFGMSDLLIATQAEPRGVGASRWNDLIIRALTRPLRQREKISLIWETYELGEIRRGSNYSVRISLVRDLTPFGAPTLELVGGTPPNVRRRQTVNDFSIEYERTVAPAPVVLDQVALSLGNTPAGNYALIVSVTDRISGRTTSRSTRVVIKP